MTKVNSQKYSKALLEVAQEKGQLEAILSEVSEMIQLFKEDNLVALLSSEVYSFSAKSELIDTLLQTSSEVMSNFLNTVRSNGRLGDLGEILDETKNAADDMFKIADVEVVSSIALTNAQIAKFTAMAKAKFDLNEVTVINTVNEKILGGFIVNSRGKIIDASLKTQLAKIAAEIL
ncbi:F0F1 ATP synthase subunit delta [Lactococcus lactis]|uniref:F0F1 ATP synthase subunit delta n=1 Tax=Lactococcus lactis TaxID=1358 RepID=UPI00223BF7A1|nr:F0F1 ATP synthase subunit delta [Lactococcus lactis]MCT0026963.1 F0F1 ATP synthase subunit delta [Lactococcus lactis subsp. lactis]MCT3104963.1 F0F1 ATP synthase subunit delta [Lactococcus lactis]